MKEEDKNHKFLITGGHLTPALAVIEELKSRGFTNFVWVGRKKTMEKDEEFSAEYNVVSTDLGIPFKNITTGKVIRFNNFSSFLDFVLNLIRIPFGFLQVLCILIKERPSAVISFGGYIAVPIVILSRVLQIPSVTHEQTVVVGLANRVISKFANKTLISWGESAKFFKKSRVKLTGNPVRKNVLNVATNSFFVNDKVKTIYITGGNQGAHIINISVFEIIEKLLKKYNVIHQTGLTTVTRDFEKADRFAKSLIGKTKGVYIVRGTIFGSEIGEVFSKADFIISRAGANIITELLALGKPCILIPIPWSINNEQLLNAKMVANVGLARIIEEKDLKPGILLESIESLMKNIARNKDVNNKSLKRTIKFAQEKVEPNAASLIVEEVLNLIK
ncbi:UDP-N-acetylglucosamine--N-acetylmuramyl-(pentapeptide) pyrophosphoryl-undecaprenol N-acetylglucosamine transferase [Candidatus Dojkabacteria bacterium]|nr:UDP-N-acetylglucosamine--N-acetylmuramyl-(pentapeptide) pyrophosphoryl-undecaprenol N-acetylglucosamine transferase [Candidatus Dojkabacteria bacterium]